MILKGLNQGLNRYRDTDTCNLFYWRPRLILIPGKCPETDSDTNNSPKTLQRMHNPLDQYRDYRKTLIEADTDTKGLIVDGLYTIPVPISVYL